MPRKSVCTLADVNALTLRAAEVQELLAKRRHSKVKSVAMQADKQLKTITQYVNILDRATREVLHVPNDVCVDDLFKRFPPDTVLEGPRIAASYRGLFTTLRQIHH